MSDAKAAKKSEVMRQKTEEFRKEFQISKPDSVIQWYECGTSTFSSGKLYISQNFICYKGGKTTERIPYTKIQQVVLKDGLGAELTVILTDNKKFVFSGFSKIRSEAKEAYEFIQYLKANAVSYVEPGVIDAHIKAQQAAAQQAAGQQQATQQRAQFNTGAVDQLLASAYDADYLQAQTAETIARQGEQINRIGTKLDGIEGQLNKADHKLKGIESCTYYIFGSQKKSPQREAALKSKVAQATPGAPPDIELDILFKKQDDSVLPAIIVLGAASFSVVHPMTGNLIEKGTQWKYDQMDQVIMRARHEHLDVRFKGSGPVKDRRLRLMCSYLQQLTNVLWTRSGKTVKVEFEPLVRKFEYKDERVLIIPPSSREQKAGGTSAANAFNRPAQSTSGLLSGQDAQASADAQYIDNALDQVHALAKGMNVRGQEMNNQIQQQTDALNGYNQRLDGYNERTANMNQRLDHQIDKY